MSNSRDSYRTGDYSSYVSSSQRDTRGRGFRERERDPRDRDPRDSRDRNGDKGRGRFDREYGQDRDKRNSYRSHDNRNDDRYRPRNDRNGYRNQGSRYRDTEKNIDPDAGLTKEQKIDKYERKLASLMAYPVIEKLPVLGSQWGVKPKGLENVTAQRAKLSGLFPLPGAPRAAEDAKIGDLLKDSSESGVLMAKSKIDPLDSRNSCIIIAKGLDFSKVAYLKVADLFDQFLRSVDLKGVTLNTNYEKLKKTKDDTALIIEFKTSVAATLALALDEKEIPASSVAHDGLQTSGSLKLSLSRPGEYVVQCLPPYESGDDELKDEVIDSPRKLTIQVDKTTTESQLQDALTEIAPLRAFKLLREVGTKESVGLAFVEFFIDRKIHPKTSDAVKLVSQYAAAARQLPMIKNVTFSCIKMSESGDIKTSIQDCPIELKTLRSMVRNEYVKYHAKSTVIQIINAVTPNDLLDDVNFRFIHHDIKEEAEIFGKVVSLRIPRPPHDYTPGMQSHVSQPGLGKVYVEFEDDKAALNAIMGLSGRSYNDRTVICAFYSHHDYSCGLL
ncbi:uncharacterized protein CXQ87_000963 [Candidozyma duobushaemuli]|uniref:RRM domain-containing protein n=2 Tax=Candidozyma TaxID=3303203 RepID=A0ABX8I2C4_9ASCO|nr:uncharacterized protein CXQ87_000963 [[Candida] duobushaemulonis]PVH18050.1 hypothetical protein CXQ87_000963 [[Candida] duobushaemulonis]QWU86618.1 hypothetical protein CA3LBN_000836 [[Candida] haemuloni]